MISAPMDSRLTYRVRKGEVGREPLCSFGHFSHSNALGLALTISSSCGDLPFIIIGRKQIGHLGQGLCMHNHAFGEAAEQHLFRKIPGRGINAAIR